MGKGPELSDADTFVALIDEKFQGQRTERHTPYVNKGDEMITALAKTAFSLCQPEGKRVGLMRSIGRSLFYPKYGYWKDLRSYRLAAQEKTLHAVGGTVTFYPRNDNVWRRQTMHSRPLGSEDFLGQLDRHAYIEEMLSKRQTRELFEWMQALKPEV